MRYIRREFKFMDKQRDNITSIWNQMKQIYRQFSDSEEIVDAALHTLNQFNRKCCAAMRSDRRAVRMLIETKPGLFKDSGFERVLTTTQVVHIN